MVLHVAIDCRVVSPHFPGIGRATLETVQALARSNVDGRLTLLTGPGKAPAAIADLAGSGSVDLVAVNSALRSAQDQIELPRLLRRLRPDVFHATYYAVPLAMPGCVVVTIYDLIPRLFPQYWPNPLVRHTINLWTARAARRADAIVACSASTADDVARLLPGTAGKTHIVPLGVAARPTACQASNLERTYLLYVGSNKPHKNLPRLVGAFARLPRDQVVGLVIAGAWDGRYPQSRQAVERLSLGDRITFEHSPSDQRLDALYRGALAFVFPSLYEGFGLPVLEAMAWGLAVATGDRGSLAEVAGDAALVFDPTREESIGACMERLIGDRKLRDTLRERGLDRAGRFSWARTASETWRVYERVAARVGR
jgi:alpha-1,3-rhamnosyl/mannosyltransferase